MAVVTHVLGPTLMPGFLMPRFYRGVTRRLAGSGPVRYHSMPERGGLGRSDRVVDSFREVMEEAGGRGDTVRLAGHSLGGIIAWVLAHEYPTVVEMAELWCAPVRGTALANVAVPVPESRFLARASRFLRRYDRPLNGPLVRAVYTPLDQLAVPAANACYVEGDNVENHIVTPFRVRAERPNTFVHRGTGEHVTLPRGRGINTALLIHDASRSRRLWS